MEKLEEVDINELMDKLILMVKINLEKMEEVDINDLIEKREKSYR